MKNRSLEGITRDALKRFNIKALKKYGQNFLIDEEILKSILEAADIKEEDYIMEIGPGLGIMTRFLCEEAKKVVAVEIDRRMIEVLRVNMSSYKNLRLVNEDVMEIDLEELLQENFEDRKCKVVANLPYYITSPIIMKILENKGRFSSVVLMVQKEVAERIAASPGGKDYGILSLAVQYHSIPEIVKIVPNTSFIPAPNVDSAIIRLTIRDKSAVSVKDEAMLFRVIRASFGQRRKTILNSLSNSGLMLKKEVIEKILHNQGIDKRRRGETLSLTEFALLSEEIGFFLKT